jgi:hypothetical protein
MATAQMHPLVELLAAIEEEWRKFLDEKKKSAAKETS